MPLESLVGSIPIPIFPILGVIIVAGYLLTNALPSVTFSENVKQIHIDYVVLFLYVLWVILRNPVSAWRYVDVEGNSYSWMFTYIQLAIIYYLGSRLLRGYNLSWLALGLLLGTTLSAIYGLSTIGIGGDLLVNFRLQGAHGDPNNFASYALCSLALLPAVQKICRNNWQIWTVTLIGVFQIIVILLTMSKTGLMALGFLMLLWLSRYKSISIVRRSLNIGIGVLLILYFYYPNRFLDIYV